MHFWCLGVLRAAHVMGMDWASTRSGRVVLRACQRCAHSYELAWAGSVRCGGSSPKFSDTSPKPILRLKWPYPGGGSGKKEKAMVTCLALWIAAPEHMMQLYAPRARPSTARPIRRVQNSLSERALSSLVSSMHCYSGAKGYVLG